MWEPAGARGVAESYGVPDVGAENQKLGHPQEPEALSITEAAFQPRDNDF